MKTTIVVEHGELAAPGPGSQASVGRSDSAATPDAPVDAGAAPNDGVGQLGAASSSNGAADGGGPPSWLLEAVAQAGGLTQASSSGEHDMDAGNAPA